MMIQRPFFVQANPETSEMFLKIRRLLKDIQSELDLSWAIMGEVYGRIDELKEMKITVRRIRTNIEEKKFVEQVHYIPEEVTFDSDPALLKLLVAPLYGENPSYGVRELLQNALDACKEREHMELSKVQNQNFSYEPVVNISIESNDKNEYYFVINDNGIGMTKETIINFFFKAGASFRRSSKWIKTFSDKEGQSAVQRSGRFGVGVLASFLLGNEIEVSTRHINEHTGLKFKATVEEEQIELIKEAELEIGTSIKILLKKEALDALRKQVEEEYYYENGRTKCWYGWYLFDRPVVNIKIPNYWNPKGLEFYKKVLYKGY
ncbi:ATP-binding protein [Cohnella rhizosphaerae]|uniref:ATP-binding protein n=1 Tax=Cohnella rhizosphaerae TaxID=1457232 RepID=A0A9X4KQ89_9BACL|nr:ATP-binding protein [Cohnella rhizosphaerae]MDG0809211.1 ATP-binding protein [Cohnella rhizosphaerae]